MSGNASSAKLFFIGTDGNIPYNGSNVAELPLKHLPMSYFPFHYGSTEKLNKLVPLLENYSTLDNKADGTPVSYTIDTEKLSSLLSELEKPYQPFNTYNINHIYVVVFSIWVCILFVMLKLIHSFISVFDEKYYLYFILSLILLICIIGILWTFFITNTVI